MSEGLIEQATVLLSAARNVTGPLRPYYCAQARLAVAQAEEALATLKLNVELIERELPAEGKSNAP